MTVLNDSATLVNVMIRNSPATKKIPKIVIKACRETNNDERNDEIIRIKRTFIITGPMTKTGINDQSLRTLKYDKPTYEVENSIVKTKSKINSRRKEKGICEN